MLKVDDVQLSFGGIKAVNGVSLSVHNNEIVGLIGPNGAGKTTLFNIIAGALQPNTGTIYFRDTRTTRMRSHELAELGLARTFQIPMVFDNISVMENMLIAAGKRADTRLVSSMIMRQKARIQENELIEQAREHLARFGLENHADHLGSELSGGQRKLLSLARVLMGNPKLILLDEPTAGVNPLISHKLADLLLDLKNEGITLFIVEHKLEFLERVANRVIVMAEGRILCEGPMDEIRENRFVLDAYLGRRQICLKQ